MQNVSSSLATVGSLAVLLVAKIVYVEHWQLCIGPLHSFRRFCMGPEGLEAAPLLRVSLGDSHRDRWSGHTLVPVKASLGPSS